MRHTVGWLTLWLTVILIYWLSVWPTDWQLSPADWPTVRKFDWLIDALNERSTKWLIEKSTVWRTYRPKDRTTDRLTYRLQRSTDWLTHRPEDRRTDWCTDRKIDWLLHRRKDRRADWRTDRKMEVWLTHRPEDRRTDVGLLNEILCVFCWLRSA